MGIENIDLTMLGHLISPEELKEIENLDFEQLEQLKSKREKWLKEKEVCFSGSEFHRLMTDQESRTLSKGAETYVIEKVLESETIQDERKKIYSLSVDWGNDTEVEAVEKFMEKTGKVVYNIGEDQEFIKISKHVGATPDGLIGKEEGIEVKCPDSKTHYHRLRYLKAENFKEMLKEYYWQIQGCMYITGRKKLEFGTINPNLVKVEIIKGVAFYSLINPKDLELLIVQAINIKKASAKFLTLIIRYGKDNV